MRPAGSGGWWQQHGSLVSNGGIASEGTLLEQHGEWVSDDFAPIATSQKVDCSRSKESKSMKISSRIWAFLL